MKNIIFQNRRVFLQTANGRLLLIGSAKTEQDAELFASVQNQTEQVLFAK